MSYINKKINIFKEAPKVDLTPKRSEARIKRYFSATDARAWCDTVEQRRQHILELMAKNKGFCLDDVLPLDSIINALLWCKNAKAKQLQKKVEYLEELLNTYSKIGLTTEQQQQVADLIKSNNLDSNEI